ncbi:hypothetical protein ACFZDG_15840 [Kitasatospora xanthocidica]|uniref:hypothetical protein n=1 Tax=Kitasatospora xanthocidica TaxID=83382 RepID=UPI0036E6775D
MAASCAVTMLATGPSWALRRPEPRPAPRPAVDIVAPGTPGTGAPGTSTTPEVSTLPAVVAGPSDSDLEVIRIDPDPAAPGDTTTVHAFVANRGPDTTASSFTVVVTLPDGVTPEGPYFPEDCEVFQGGHRVRCVFGPGLPPLRTATALIPVRLAPDLPMGTLSGGWVAVRGADDRNERNNRQPFDIAVVETTGGS